MGSEMCIRDSCNCNKAEIDTDSARCVTSATLKCRARKCNVEMLGQEMQCSVLGQEVHKVVFTL